MRQKKVAVIKADIIYIEDIPNFQQEVKAFTRVDNKTLVFWTGNAPYETDVLEAINQQKTAIKNAIIALIINCEEKTIKIIFKDELIKEETVENVFIEGLGDGEWASDYKPSTITIETE